MREWRIHTRLAAQSHAYYVIVFLALLLGNTERSYAQFNTSGIDTAKVFKSISPGNNTLVREEIQRYLGYEDLLPRYLTLPYDVTMNTNVQGNFADIGYLLLMFIPVLFLLGFRSRPLWSLLTCALLMVWLIICLSNSFLFDASLQKISPAQSAEINQFAEKNSFSNAPISAIAAGAYQIAQPLYAPFRQSFKSISGQRDYVTYPVLVLLFGGLFFLLCGRLQDKNTRIKTLAYILLLYSFLWFLLAAGIIWYGYIILPMACLLIFSSFSENRTDTYLPARIAKYFFWGMVGIWVCIAAALKISNIYYINDSGKDLYKGPVLLYQVGNFDKEEVYDSYFYNLSSALTKINSEDTSLIYRVGTSLPFFIKKNDKRVFMDNLLGLYIQIAKKYPTKGEINKILKASGFKYILVGLNVAKLDQTPEKTLREKFKVFMGFLYNNPGLELMATDNIVLVPGKNGQGEQQKFDVFGKTYRAGTYAIYALK